jgi:hypothetical protein
MQLCNALTLTAHAAGSEPQSRGAVHRRAGPPSCLVDPICLEMSPIRKPAWKQLLTGSVD